MLLSGWLVLAFGAAVLFAVAPALASHSAAYGCNACHAPHRAGKEGDPDASWGVPLWSSVNTKDGLPTYTLYTSLTFAQLGSDIAQPDGPSKLCLGCHDGSYIGFAGGANASFVFGAQDLTRSHPISFTYNSAMAAKVRGLNDPATTQSGLGGTIAQNLLDIKGKLQCTSCHDVHATGFGQKMLRYNTTGDSMCMVCHNK
jgi:predicted CXXCH cytochrome family protein